MTHSEFPFRHENEARLLRMAPDAVPEKKVTDVANDGKNVVNELSDDRRDFFRYFAEVPGVTADNLNAYFDKDKDGPLSPLETDIKHDLDLLSGKEPGTTAEVAEASRKVNDVLADINGRNKVLKDHKNALRDFEAKRETIPSPTRLTYEGGKKVLGGVTEGFMKADLKDKGIMLAGALAAFLLVRSLWQRGSGGGIFKKLLMLGGGFLLTAAAFEAFNKTTEKVTGRPAVTLQGAKKSVDKLPGDVADLDGKAVKDDVVDIARHVDSPVLTNTQEEWDARKYAMEIEELTKLVDDMDLPDEFLKEIDAVPSAKMMPTVASVAPMSVEDFLATYQRGRATGTVNLLPRRSLPADKMTPQERFAVMEDIAKTLHLIDPATGDPLPVSKERQGASMMFLMFDWRNIPE